MSNDNLLNKLRQKNRQRANVTQRKDSLLTTTSSPNESLENSGKNNIQEQQETSFTTTNSNHNSQTTLEELKQQLAQFPNTRRRSGIVLEEELDLELTTYCKKNGITVETFLEAAWLIVSEKEAILKKINKEAKNRYAQRKEAGHLRRLITTLEKQL
jgi:hypothetical protein